VNHVDTTSATGMSHWHHHQSAAHLPTSQYGCLGKVVFAYILPWNLVTQLRNFINMNACNDYEIKPSQRRMHVFLQISSHFGFVA
jgi:hypothetical protein